MRAVLLLAMLLVTACETRAPRGPQTSQPPADLRPSLEIPQTGERPQREMPAPDWIKHHPATGHLVV